MPAKPDIKQAANAALNPNIFDCSLTFELVVDCIGVAGSVDDN